MIVRVYYRELGGHTHMRVFAGEREGALAKCGDLIMRNYEFLALKAGLRPARPWLLFKAEGEQNVGE